MGTGQLVELEQVLDLPEEPVGVGQVAGVVPGHVTARRQRRQRRQGRRAAQRLIGAAVHELQELDGELDVPQAAGAQLDLPARLRRGQRLFHPAPHGLHVFNEPLPLGRPPDHRGQRVDVLPAELHVPGGGAGLQQRLELPGLGPALVIGDVAGQGADQRAVAPLRPQVRVDREDHAFRRGPGAHRDQAGRELRRGTQRGIHVLARVLARAGPASWPAPVPARGPSSAGAATKMTSTSLA